MDLREALAKLDPNSDEDWTADGLPRVDTVAAIVGSGSVTREQITNAAPGLTRSSVQQPSENAAPAPWDEPAEPAEPPAPEATLPRDEPLTPEDARAQLDAQIAEAEKVTGSDVLNVPMHVAVHSDVVLQEVVRVLDEQSMAKLRQKEAIERELQDIWHRSQLASRLLQRLIDSKPRNEHEERKRHLEQLRKAREEKIKNAQRFIASGTTQETVRELLDGRSKLDQMYAARKKPAIGSTPVAPRSVAPPAP